MLEKPNFSKSHTDHLTKPSKCVHGCFMKVISSVRVCTHDKWFELLTLALIATGKRNNQAPHQQRTNNLKTGLYI